MNPLENYLEELYVIRSSGGAVKETSYYPALSNLLNEVGKTLKPRVRCIINIQNAIWDYTIGGYQVIKKWLSYREHKLLGRPLTTDEAREVMNIARRIAAILLLEPSLDANYQAIKSATYTWPSS